MNSEESVAAILADLRTKLSAEIDLVRGIGEGNRQTEETLRAGRQNSRGPVLKVLVSGKEATRSLDRLIDVSGARDGRNLLENCKIFSRKTLSASLYLLREHFIERDHGKKAIRVKTMTRLFRTVGRLLRKVRRPEGLPQQAEAAALPACTNRGRREARRDDACLGYLFGGAGTGIPRPASDIDPR